MEDGRLTISKTRVVKLEEDPDFLKKIDVVQLVEEFKPDNLEEIGNAKYRKAVQDIIAEYKPQMPKESCVKMEIRLEDENKKIKSKGAYMCKEVREKEEKLNKDAEVMKAIIKERDNLKDQLAKMVGMEDKIAVLRKMQCLEQELVLTKKQLKRSEIALDDYECQMRQLMDVIEELETQKCFCGCDQGNGVKLDDGHVHDLIMASRLTLEQVQEEISARDSLQEELRRRVEEIEDLKKQASEESEQIRRASDTKIADLLKQLEKCKSDNKKLKDNVKELDGKLKESEAELETVKKKVASIREDIRGSATKTPQSPIEEEPLLNVSGGVEKCCEEARLLRDQITEERQKCSAERALLENKLQDMTELYTKAKDDCDKSKSSFHQAADEVNKLNKEREHSNAEILALNGGLEEQKELLTAVKGGLEQYRKELSKCSDKAQRYKVGDLVAIKRIQFAPGAKLFPKFLGLYEITMVRSNDRYNVKKVGNHEGPNFSSSAAEFMKPWSSLDVELDASGTDEDQDGRMWERNS